MTYLVFVGRAWPLPLGRFEAREKSRWRATVCPLTGVLGTKCEIGLLSATRLVLISVTSVVVDNYPSVEVTGICALGAKLWQRCLSSMLLPCISRTEVLLRPCVVITRRTCVLIVVNMVGLIAVGAVLLLPGKCVLVGSVAVSSIAMTSLCVMFWVGPSAEPTVGPREQGRLWEGRGGSGACCKCDWILLVGLASGGLLCWFVVCVLRLCTSDFAFSLGWLN